MRGQRGQARISSWCVGAARAAARAVLPRSAVESLRPIVGRRGRPQPDLVWDGLHIALVMPKAGASTLRAVLKSLRLDGVVHGAHTLNLPRLVAEVPRGTAGEPGITQDDLNLIFDSARLSTLLEVRRDQRARALAANRPAPPKPCIVTSIREPIDRALSYVFFATELMRGQEVVSRLTPDDVASMLLGSSPLPFPPGPFGWWDPSEWFDDELLGVFDLDVFASPFDAERGWQTYENENVRAVLVRQENFGDLPEALARFYGIDAARVPVIRSNSAAERGYDEHYRSVRARLTLPDELLDRVYSGRLGRHFYSAGEIRQFAGKWSRREAGGTERL